MDTLLNAVWAVDSETGEEWLIDVTTGNKIINRKELNSARDC